MQGIKQIVLFISIFQTICSKVLVEDKTIADVVQPIQRKSLDLNDETFTNYDYIFVEKDIFNNSMSFLRSMFEQFPILGKQMTVSNGTIDVPLKEYLHSEEFPTFCLKMNEKRITKLKLASLMNVNVLLTLTPGIFKLGNHTYTAKQVIDIYGNDLKNRIRVDYSSAYEMIYIDEALSDSTSFKKMIFNSDIPYIFDFQIFAVSQVKITMFDLLYSLELFSNIKVVHGSQEYTIKEFKQKYGREFIGKLKVHKDGQLQSYKDLVYLLLKYAIFKHLDGLPLKTTYDVLEALEEVPNLSVFYDGVLYPLKQFKNGDLNKAVMLIYNGNLMTINEITLMLNKEGLTFFSEIVSIENLVNIDILYNNTLYNINDFKVLIKNLNNYKYHVVKNDKILTVDEVNTLNKKIGLLSGVANDYGGVEIIELYKKIGKNLIFPDISYQDKIFCPRDILEKLRSTLAVLILFNGVLYPVPYFISMYDKNPSRKFSIIYLKEYLRPTDIRRIIDVTKGGHDCQHQLKNPEVSLPWNNIKHPTEKLTLKRDEINKFAPDANLAFIINGIESLKSTDNPNVWYVRNGQRISVEELWQIFLKFVNPYLHYLLNYIKYSQQQAMQAGKAVNSVQFDPTAAISKRNNKYIIPYITNLEPTESCQAFPYIDDGRVIYTPGDILNAAQLQQLSDVSIQFNSNTSLENGFTTRCFSVKHFDRRIKPEDVPKHVDVITPKEKEDKFPIIKRGIDYLSPENVIEMLFDNYSIGLRHHGNEYLADQFSSMFTSPPMFSLTSSLSFVSNNKILQNKSIFPTITIDNIVLSPLQVLKQIKKHPGIVIHAVGNKLDSFILKYNNIILHPEELYKLINVDNLTVVTSILHDGYIYTSKDILEIIINYKYNILVLYNGRLYDPLEFSKIFNKDMDFELVKDNQKIPTKSLPTIINLKPSSIYQTYKYIPSRSILYTPRHILNLLISTVRDELQIYLDNNLVNLNELQQFLMYGEGKTVTNIMHRGATLTPNDIIKLINVEQRTLTNILIDDKVYSLNVILDALIKLDDPNCKIRYYNEFYTPGELYYKYTNPDDYEVYYKGKRISLIDVLKMLMQRKYLSPNTYALELDGKKYYPYDTLYGTLLEPNVQVVHKNKSYTPNEFITTYIGNIPNDFFLQKDSQIYYPDKKDKKFPTFYTHNNEIYSISDILICIKFLKFVSVIYENRIYDINEFIKKFNSNFPINIIITYKGKWLTPNDILKVIKECKKNYGFPDIIYKNSILNQEEILEQLKNKNNIYVLFQNKYYSIKDFLSLNDRSKEIVVENRINGIPFQMSPNDLVETKEEEEELFTYLTDVIINNKLYSRDNILKSLSIYNPHEIIVVHDNVMYTVKDFLKINDKNKYLNTYLVHKNKPLKSNDILNYAYPMQEKDKFENFYYDRQVYTHENVIRALAKLNLPFVKLYYIQRIIMPIDFWNIFKKSDSVPNEFIVLVNGYPKFGADLVIELAKYFNDYKSTIAKHPVIESNKVYYNPDINIIMEFLKIKCQSYNSEQSSCNKYRNRKDFREAITEPNEKLQNENVVYVKYHNKIYSSKDILMILLAKKINSVYLLYKSKVYCVSEFIVAFPIVPVQFDFMTRNNKIDPETLLTTIEPNNVIVVHEFPQIIQNGVTYTVKDTLTSLSRMEIPFFEVRYRSVNYPLDYFLMNYFDNLPVNIEIYFHDKLLDAKTIFKLVDLRKVDVNVPFFIKTKDNERYCKQLDVQPTFQSTPPMNQAYPLRSNAPKEWHIFRNIVENCTIIPIINTLQNLAMKGNDYEILHKTHFYRPSDFLRVFTEETSEADARMFSIWYKGVRIVNQTP